MEILDVDILQEKGNEYSIMNNVKEIVYYVDTSRSSMIMNITISIEWWAPRPEERHWRSVSSRAS